MLSLKQLREIDPKFKEITDEELIKLRESLYALANLAADSFIDSKQK